MVKTAASGGVTRKRARDASPSAEPARLRLLEAALASSPDGIVIADAAGRITFANEAGRRLLGWSHEGANPAGDKPPRYAPQPGEGANASGEASPGRGQQVADFALRFPDGRPVPPEEAPLARALRGETVAEGLFIVDQAGGADVCLRCTASPVRDEQGRLAGALATFRPPRLPTRPRRSRLAEAEHALLEAVLRQLPSGVNIIEAPSGRRLLANEQLARVWGRATMPDHYSTDDFGSMPGFHPDGRRYEGEEWPAHRSLRSGEVVVDEEIEIERGDGRRGIISVSSAPVRDPEGRIVAAVSAVTDVSERKQVEAERERLLQEVQTERARLAAVLEQLPAGILIAEAPSGRLLAGNRRFEEIWRSPGLPATAAVEECGRWTALHPDGRVYPAEERPLARSLRTGAAMTEEEFQILRGDGTRGWINASAAPIRDAAGRIVAAVAVQIDITERKRAEAERERLLAKLRESNEQLALSGLREREAAQREGARAAELEATIASIPDGVVIYAPDQTIIRLNPAAEAILGYTPDQYETTLAERQRLVPHESPEGELFLARDLPLARALRGETVLGQRMVLRRGERKVWTSTSAAPIRGPEGRLLGAVAVFSDITSLRELEEQREDFIRTVSHDLRQPLTVIGGTAQWLLPKLAQAGLAREGANAERIVVSARRMGAMIQDLVDSTRLAAGKMEMRREIVDPIRLISEIAGRVGSLSEQVRLRVEAAEWVPPVLADPAFVERVVANLVSNALKYSGEDKPVVVHAVGGQAEVVISVADEGAGIRPEDLPHLFQRYYRGLEMRQRHEGLGLGLYISRLIVEAHGGRIWVESRPGEGSTFCFTLPLA